MSDAHNKQPERNPNIAADALVGTKFDNRYEIISLLGTGASSTAYKAMDRTLERMVAVKIIHSHLLGAGDFEERFKREALISIKLDHPNIAHVYAFGKAPDGRLYLVMDLLEGQSLAAILKTEQKLELGRFLHLFKQLIDALDYAHQQAVVHRDIKPDNIIVSSDSGNEIAHLVDFGIAKAVDDSSGQDATRTGALLGSSSYMSPEQCRGAKIDRRADIYSLGCVMLESLLGESPFAGSSELDIMYKQINESLSSLGSLKKLPAELSQIIRKCLEKDPEKRYQSAADLKDEFQKCLEMQDTLKRRFERASAPKQNLNWIKISVLVILLTAITFAATYILQQGTQKRNKAAVLAPNQKTSIIKSAKDQRVPATQEEMARLLEKYHLTNDRLFLLKEWLRKYGQTKDSNSSAVCWMRLRYSEELERANFLEDSQKNYEALLKTANTAENRCRLALVESKLLLKAEKTDLALQKMTSAMNSNKSDISEEMYSMLLDARAELYRIVGDLQKAKMDNEKALQLVNKIASKCDDPSIFYPRMVPLLVSENRQEELDELVNKWVKLKTLEYKRDEAARIYNEVAEQIAHRGNLSQSKKYFNLAIEEYKKAGDHVRAEQSLVELAAVLKEHGDQASAVEAYRTILDQHTNSDVIYKLKILNEICILSMQTNATDSLAVYSKQALALLEKELKKDPALMQKADVQILIGPVTSSCDLIAKQQGNKAAESFLLEWIKKYENTAFAAMLRFKLIGQYCLMNQAEKGEKIIVQARAFFSQLAPDKYKGLNKDAIKQNLILCDYLQTAVLIAANKRTEAIALCDRLLKEPELPEITKLELLQKKGNSQEELGKQNESFKTFQSLEKELLSGNYYNTLAGAGFLANYGYLLDKYNKPEEAEKKFNTSIRIKSQTIGENSEQLIPEFNALIHAQLVQKKVDPAIVNLQRAIRICKMHKLDQTTLNFLGTLETCYREKKEYNECEKITHQMIPLCTAEDLPETYYRLSAVSFLQKNPDNYSSALKKCLDAYAKASSKANSYLYCARLRELGAHYYQANQLDKGMPYLEKSLKVGKSLPNDENSIFQTASTDSLLAEIYQGNGDFQKSMPYHREAAELLQKLGSKYSANYKSALESWLNCCKQAKMEKEAAEVEDKLKLANS
jgi:serine/threonine protein kinase